MGLAEAKNDIKMIFFIVNFLIGLIPGIYVLGCSIAIGVEQGSWAAALVAVLAVVGLLLLGLTALGYAGAILEKKIMLFVYSGFITLIALVNLVSFIVVDSPLNRNGRGSFVWLASTIAHLGLSVIDVALAVTLGLQAAKSNARGRQGIILSPAPTSYSPGV